MKKILIICDDFINTHTGVATMAKLIVSNTLDKYKWVHLAIVNNHPHKDKYFDISKQINPSAKEGSVIMYCKDRFLNEGGHNLSKDIIDLKFIIDREKIDMIFLFTDPRSFTNIFIKERSFNIPIFYYNIWDSPPLPYYNKPYYESCTGLCCINKVSYENIPKILDNNLEGKHLSYVPHGNDENIFKKLDNNNNFTLFKKNIYNNNKPKFVLLFNSHNQHRKNLPSIIEAWRKFIIKNKNVKVEDLILLLHTLPVDHAGTNIPDIIKLFFGGEKHNIFFTGENHFSPEEMNMLYNCSNAVILISNQEGFGISINEGMLSERLIICSTSGGIKDQTKEPFSLIVPTENTQIIGSVPTPYIYDERVNTDVVADKILEAYNLVIKGKSEELGKQAREYCLNNKLNKTDMVKGISESIDETFKIFKPRKKYDFLKISKFKREPFIS